MKKHICVLGLGYMGLPTSALFATAGYKVTGVDVNEKKVKAIQNREIPFEEPGLKELIFDALDTGNFSVQTTLPKADVFLIAVPTPITSDKRADVTYVEKAADMIATVLEKGNLVILESTVPPATCEKVIIPRLEKSGLTAGKDFLVSHCPERAIPGNTLHELIHNDRIIGGTTPEAAEATQDLYKDFVKGTILLTDATTAEMVKLMENTTRDVNIALANEFAKLAEELGINVWEAIPLANRHPRINILQPGPGVGGHCIAVDPWFLTQDSQHAHIICSARTINDAMPQHVVDTVKKFLPTVKQPKITVLGVAYKPNVDDARETPAEHVIHHAKQEGWNVAAHDPHVKPHEFPDLTDLETSLTDTDAIVLVTHHDDYKQLDPDHIKSLVRNPLVVDTRNHLDKEKWAKAGFTVITLGNGKPLTLPTSLVMERTPNEASVN